MLGNFQNSIKNISFDQYQAAGATASSELLLGPVPAGAVWVVTDVGVENANGTASVALLSVSRGGVRIPFDRLTTLVAGVPQFIHHKTVIPQNAYLSVLLTTIQATTDILHVYLAAIEGPADLATLLG